MSARKFYIWHDQEAEDEFGWLVGEFPPTEMAYTYDVLEIDIDPTDMDRHAKAQKGQDIFDYLSEQGITYKHMECYSKIYTGTVVYDLVNQEWGLLEDMETTPVATHWTEEAGPKTDSPKGDFFLAPQFFGQESRILATSVEVLSNAAG